MSTIALHSTLNISETVRDRGLVPKDHQYEMAYWLSSGHVTDDVMSYNSKVLLGSTVGYPSDSLASCLFTSLLDFLQRGENNRSALCKPNSGTFTFCCSILSLLYTSDPEFFKHLTFSDDIFHFLHSSSCDVG